MNEDKRILEAFKKKTEQGYKAWLSEYPSGPDVDLAKQFIEGIDNWVPLCNLGYLEYLMNYKNPFEVVFERCYYRVDTPEKVVPSYIAEEIEEIWNTCEPECDYEMEDDFKDWIRRTYHPDSLEVGSNEPRETTQEMCQKMS